MSKSENNRCPKCGEKLSLFYFKQNCPKCGTNLLYYDMENRLAADARQAQKEWDAVSRLCQGVLDSTFRSVYAIIRLVCYILSICAMMLPVFKTGDLSFDLISIIKGIMNGDIAFGALLTMGLLPTLALVVGILMTLVCLVVSLFSYTKNGMKRDVALGIIQIVSFVALSVGTVAVGIEIKVGCVVVALTMAVSLVMSILLGKKLKAKGETHSKEKEETED